MKGVAVFAELLDDVMARMPGALAVTLMGFDGIAIESRQAPGSGDDWQAATVEIANIAAQLRRMSEGLGTGDVEDLVVQTGGLTTVLRPLTSEYFVALALSPGAFTGKGRYLLRVVGPKLMKELV